MKTFLPMLCFLLVVVQLPAQAPFAFSGQRSRQQHDQRLRDSVIGATFQQTPTSASEQQWLGAFWAAELMLHRDAVTLAALTRAWQQAPSLSENFQKALLEATYTLYPTEFSKPVEALLHTTASPALFIRCAAYLLRSKPKQAPSAIARILKRRFHQPHPALDVLQQQLQPQADLHPASFAPLFTQAFLPGKTVVFSLQNRNRDYPGLVVIRKPDGSFVRNSSGGLFSVPQLARAITNYPFYITNGNTPQGIFRWTGFGVSDNNYIGPTTNLQLLMPVEASPAQFFNDSHHTPAWTLQQYTALLPSPLRHHAGLQESYHAGAVGRSEIIMHGTTINPAYYRARPYFPQTPSLGCLCSYEEWDQQGIRGLSYQQQIVSALQQSSATEGYVVVIDITNTARAVELSDLAPLLPPGER